MTNYFTKTEANSTFIDFTTNQTISGGKTFNNVLYAKNKLVVGINGNAGLNLEVLQQLYLYSVNSPFTDYARILNVGGGTMRYHSYSPIQGYSSKHDFYSSLTGADDASKVVSFETGAALTKVYNTFEVAGQAIFNNGAIFNTVLPTTTITATSSNELVNFTTLNSQSFIKSSSNINFTGFNTFQNYTTFKASLDLLDGTGTKSGNIIMEATGTLIINNNTLVVQLISELMMPEVLIIHEQPLMKTSLTFKFL
jgi:hypothetical protein